MKFFFYNSNINIIQNEAMWKVKDINTIRKVLKVSDLKKKGLSIKLSNDKYVKEINYKWKGINRPTNILSFPNEEKTCNIKKNTVYLGDVVLAYETLKKETKIKNINLQKHLSHILIHGILHLKGYTHNKIEDTKSMQNEEIRILKNLKIKNPHKL